MSSRSIVIESKSTSNRVNAPLGATIYPILGTRPDLDYAFGALGKGTRHIREEDGYNLPSLGGVLGGRQRAVNMCDRVDPAAAAEDLNRLAGASDSGKGLLVVTPSLFLLPQNFVWQVAGLYLCPHFRATTSLNNNKNTLIHN